MFSWGGGGGGGGGGGRGNGAKVLTVRGALIHKTFPYLPKAVLLCMVDQFDYVLVGVHVDTVVFLNWNVL